MANTQKHSKRNNGIEGPPNFAAVIYANDGMRAAVIQLNLPMNEHNHLLIRMYNRYLIFENKRGRLNKLNDMK